MQGTTGTGLPRIAAELAPAPVRALAQAVPLPPADVKVGLSLSGWCLGQANLHPCSKASQLVACARVVMPAQACAYGRFCISC